MSNTIAACNYLSNNTKHGTKAKQETTNRISSRKRWLPRTGHVNTNVTTPTIVISPDNHDTTEDDEHNTVANDTRKTLSPPKRRDSFGDIALKVRDKSLGKERRKSHGDMSHIRAKWLLGFNLTMVITITYNNKIPT